MSEDLDPFTNIPYVTVPSHVRDLIPEQYLTLTRSALYFCDVLSVLVKNVRKDVLVMVTPEGILMSKVKNNKPCRYVAHEKVCEMVTNVDAESLEAIRTKSAPEYAPFVLLTLVQTEPGDIIFLSNDRYEVALLFSVLVKIWSTIRDFPQVRVATKAVPQLKQLEIDYRVSKSARSKKPVKPAFTLLISKVRRQQEFESKVSKDLPVLTKYLDDLEAEKEVALQHRRMNFDLLPSSLTKVENAEREVLRKKEARDKNKKKEEEEEAEATGRVKGCLVLPMEEELGKKKERTELPVKLADVRRSYTLKYAKHETRDELTGIPYAHVPFLQSSDFPDATDPTKAVLFFESVLVNDGKDALVSSHVYFCPLRFFIADTEQRLRFCANISDISNIIQIEQLGEMEVKNGDKCAECVVIMFREDMPDFLVGFKHAGSSLRFIEYLRRVVASSEDPSKVHVTRCKTLPEVGAKLDLKYEYPVNPFLLSLKPMKEILAPSDREGLYPAGDFKLTEEMINASPRLEKGAVKWAGFVQHFPTPYLGKKPRKEAFVSSRCLLFVSLTHCYMCRDKEEIRCFNTNLIRQIDLQTLKNKFVTDARKQKAVIVCDEPEYDFCVEFPFEEDGQRCIAAILQSCRRTVGARIPPILAFDQMTKNYYHFTPPASYRKDQADLPLRLDYFKALGELRNKIARYFVVNDPQCINQSLDLAQANVRDPKALFARLISQYKSLPEANPNITNYRARLVRFFERYDPEELPRVPVVLEEGRGAEEELIYRLALKYGGPEPPIPSPTECDFDDQMTRALREIFKRFDPEKVPLAREIREKHYGREKELLEVLRREYGAREDDPLFDLPELLTPEQLLTLPRLRRYLMRYLPENTSEEDARRFLMMHRGNIDDLFRDLVRQYGPEPPRLSNQGRARLRRFFERYEPRMKLDDDSLDYFYAAFKGTKNEMFEMLVEKYGPEPLLEGAEHLAGVFDECIDLSKDLPFADVPDELYDRFAEMIERPRAIYWFSEASHWEPTLPSVLCYVYLTSSHLYLAESENKVRRCVRIGEIRVAYINVLREDKADNGICSLLLQLNSDTTHDLFLSFPSDEAAKNLLWVLAEIIAKQNYKRRVDIIAVKNFDEVDARLSPYYHLNGTIDLSKISDPAVVVAPIPRRPTGDNANEDGVKGVKDLRPLRAQEVLGDPSKGAHFAPITVAGPFKPSDRDKENAADLGVPINRLQLKNVVFGNSLPNYKGLIPRNKAVWHPADDVMAMQITEAQFHESQEKGKEEEAAGDVDLPSGEAKRTRQGGGGKKDKDYRYVFGGRGLVGKKVGAKKTAGGQTEGDQYGRPRLPLNPYQQQQFLKHSADGVFGLNLLSATEDQTVNPEYVRVHRKPTAPTAAPYLDKPPVTFDFEVIQDENDVFDGEAISLDRIDYYGNSANGTPQTVVNDAVRYDNNIDDLTRFQTREEYLRGMGNIDNKDKDNGVGYKERTTTKASYHRQDGEKREFSPAVGTDYSSVRGNISSCSSSAYNNNNIIDGSSLQKRYKPLPSIPEMI